MTACSRVLVAGVAACIVACSGGDAQLTPAPSEVPTLSATDGVAMPTATPTAQATGTARPTEPVETSMATASAPTPTGAGGCVTDAQFFSRQVEPILEGDCIYCHVAGGTAAQTRNVLVAGDPEVNRATLAPLAAELANGLSLLLAKPTAYVPHDGGRRFGEGSAQYEIFDELIARYAQPGGCARPEAPVPCSQGQVGPGDTPFLRLTDRQVLRSIEDLLAVRVPDGLFPPTDAGKFYSTWESAGAVSASGVEGILLTAEYAAEAALANPPASLGCDLDDGPCLGAWAPAFARRAARRPLHDDELAVVHGLMDGVSPGEGARRVIEMMLQSPQFLYQELAVGPALEGQPDVYRLTDHAIAARLSLFLLNTGPDEALLAAADKGEVHSPEQVRAWARQMLADPRSIDAVRAFHEDWAQTWRLDAAVKDPGRYPDFTQALVDQMKTELDLFVTEVFWLGSGTFDTLMWSPVSWTTPDLEALYGIEVSRQGTDWQRTNLDPLTRPGILSRLGMLTGFAYTASSSPVKRGVFVLEHLLCETLVPPANVDMNLDEPGEGETIRDTLAAHSADPACSGCHARIDPVGFSMENYGATGEWRDSWDNGIEVDATGSLEDPTGEFDGITEMLDLITEQGRVQGCYAEHWLRYAAGRPTTVDDRCTVGVLTERFAATGGDVRDLLVGIAASDALLYRRLTDGETP